ncbi:hypothetical protein Tco_1043612 [Tanacetum coccineum]|uniref:Uncharacterized protein n=1 Tax=Tanacetum coccineum TaxID=301880 RepID=A0ABQ5GPK1_9ASTR
MTCKGDAGVSLPRTPVRGSQNPNSELDYTRVSEVPIIDHMDALHSEGSSRLINKTNVETLFGAKFTSQSDIKVDVSNSSPLVSESTTINVPRELNSIDVAVTFGVPLSTVGDLHKLINDIEAGKRDELLSGMTNDDRIETLDVLGVLSDDLTLKIDGGGVFGMGGCESMCSIFGNGSFSRLYEGLWWLIMDEEDDEVVVWIAEVVGDGILAREAPSSSSSSPNDQLTFEASDHARQLSYAGRTRKQPYWLDRPPAKYTDYLWIRRSSAEERFNEVVDTYQDPEELEDRGIILDNSTLTFAKRLKRCLKVDKLNLSKLEEFGKDGYELFGNRFTSKAEYDYNMDQMTIAMSDDMDWATDYGLGLDSNEPLPLGRKYALFITKCHAAEYKIEWIEEDNGNLFRRTLVDYDADAMLGIHHWEKMKRLSYRGKRSATIVEKVALDLSVTHFHSLIYFVDLFTQGYHFASGALGALV